MSIVADQLRRAREAKSLTIQQVAEITKLRTDHILALEEGNYDVFSAPVYIRGFVRTYAGILKLDVPAVIAALDEELSQTAKFAEPPSLSDQPKGLLDSLMLQLSKMDLKKGAVGLGGLILLVALVFIYFLVQHQKTSDPLSGLKPAIYQPTQNLSGDTLPIPPARNGR